MFELLEAIIDIIKYFGLALVSLAVAAFFIYMIIGVFTMN
jgi:hypothetical protein